MPDRHVCAYAHVAGAAKRERAREKERFCESERARLPRERLGRRSPSSRMASSHLVYVCVSARARAVRGASRPCQGARGTGVGLSLLPSGSFLNHRAYGRSSTQSLSSGPLAHFSPRSLVRRSFVVANSSLAAPGLFRDPCRSANLEQTHRAGTPAFYTIN